MERSVLKNVIRNNLSLPTVVNKMVERNEHGQAVLHFCATIMARKERNERVRRRERDFPLTQDGADPTPGLISDKAGGRST